MTFGFAALLLLIVTLPAHWLLLRRPWPPESRVVRGESDNESKLYVARTRSSFQFRLLASGLAIASLAMYAALIAIVPLMLERGYSATAAAWVLGLGGLGQVLGRLVYSVISHRFSLRGRTALVFALVTVSTLLIGLIPGPIGVLVAASMIAGVGRGIATLLQATAIPDRWGTRAYAHLSGVLGAPLLFAMALGPWTGTALASITGSYPLAFVALAGVAFVGGVLILFSTPPTKPSAHEV